MGIYLVKVSKKCCFLSWSNTYPQWKTIFPQWFVCLFSSLLLLSGCQVFDAKHQEQDLVQIQSKEQVKEQRQPAKKVIFFMVDSLMSQALEQGLKQGKLPTFQRLIEQGQFYPEVVSSFPTMSVTIDSTLLTGAYPDEHKVPGLIWFAADEQRLINYGTGWREIAQGGLNSFLNDTLISLNQAHLNKQKATIFEELAELGLSTGVINGLIYRGKSEQILTIPAWLHVPTDLFKQIEVTGPDFLSLGIFANPLTDVLELPENVAENLGFNNEYSFKVVNYLIQSGNLPDFLYVYLPDLDQEMHKKGPLDLKGIQELDEQLVSLLESFGSIEQALEEVVLVFSGDSGQTKITVDETKAVVQLENYLQGYNILPSGSEAEIETDIVLAVNERMAYLYSFAPPLHELAELFQEDSRLDLIAWQEQDWIYILQGGTGKFLRYKPQGEYKDEYGQAWSVEGELEVLGLILEQGNQEQLGNRVFKQMIKYEKYPDVLKRLWAAFNSHEGSFLILTAKPGYELAAEHSPKHLGGGGHGSLHYIDSLVPLIITGTEEKPERLRLVDLKAYLLKLLTGGE